MVLFIPGFFSGPINTLFGTYFIDQFKTLNNLGKEYVLAPINTEHDVKTNGAKIAEFLRGKKDVTVVTHSKGGVDLLEALLQCEVARGNVKEAICLQAPFFGTPIVDLVNSSLLLKSIVKPAIFFSRGHKDAFNELSPKGRMIYMQENADEIDRIIRVVPITCIGSACDTEEGSVRSLLYPFIKYLQKTGHIGDGIVPAMSTQLPGATNKIINNIDHSTLVVRRTLQKFDRKSFSQMLFSRNLGSILSEFNHG